MFKPARFEVELKLQERLSAIRTQKPELYFSRGTPSLDELVSCRNASATRIALRSGWSGHGITKQNFSAPSSSAVVMEAIKDGAVLSLMSTVLNVLARYAVMKQYVS